MKGRDGGLKIKGKKKREERVKEKRILL